MSATDLATLRTRMVDNQLRTTDVTNHAVLSAFLSVARELFVPAAKQELAYVDTDIELGGGRFVMEPSPLARMIQLADIKSSDRVLIVGAGTGYGAAIVARLSKSVVALEDNAELAAAAAATLDASGEANVEVVTGPLPGGAPSKAPFEVVIIEGAVDAVPPALLGQLAEGGRLIAVEGVNLTGVARVYLRSGAAVSARRAFNLAVKPLAAFKAEPAFSL
jgi:protein-L-isoaspartate(D-aspartate) O-methyltransferase